MKNVAKKLVLTVIILTFISNLTAAVDWDITEGVNSIQSGDSYGNVNIYTTSTEPTTVNMTGGSIDTCNVYDTSVLSLEGGSITALKTYNNSSVYIDSDASTSFELYNGSSAHLSSSSSSVSVLIYDQAKLNIYGRNLDYNELMSPNIITGQWENGEAFTIYLRNIFSYDSSQIILHEIPEPVSLLFLATGTLFFKRRY